MPSEWRGEQGLHEANPQCPAIAPAASPGDATAVAASSTRQHPDRTCPCSRVAQARCRGQREAPRRAADDSSPGQPDPRGARLFAMPMPACSREAEHAAIPQEHVLPQSHGQHDPPIAA